MRTIAIDFDGVIHKYSKGWADGSIYDDPISGAFEFIREAMKTHTIFVFSSRSPWQIKRWINNYLITHDPEFDTGFSVYGFEAEVIPFWKKFWDKPNRLGITRRKLPAEMYIDDRAIRFSGSFEGLLT